MVTPRSAAAGRNLGVTRNSFQNVEPSGYLHGQIKLLFHKRHRDESWSTMAGRRSILVTNLPDIKEGSLLDKLEIHFGKRSNGGDDVDSVKIEKQSGVPGIYAVITFAEEETVSSVLKKQQIFFGEKLQIQPYFPTNGASVGDVSKMCHGIYIQDDCSNCTASHENYGNLTSTSSGQKVQLVISRQFQGDLLESIAASTKTQLGVDEKTARFTFTGHPHDVMTAATRLSSYRNETKIHPFAVSDSNGKEEIEDSEITKAFEKFQLGNNPLEDDRTSHNHGIVYTEQPDGEVRQCETILHSVKRKILPKPSQKLLKSSSPYKTVKHSRSSAKFDQKILDYIGLVHLRAVEMIRKEFMVNFDKKRGGVVEVSCQGANTDQQNIKDAIEALEGLVNQTKQMGLITEIVDVRQFPDTSKEVWEIVTKDARSSTQVLVTQRTWGRLEFFGTEHEVHQEIAKLRNTVLGRRSPDELDRDDINKDGIDQEVSEERDGRQDLVEGTRGQAERDAQIKKEVALAKEQTDGLLAHPFGDAVHGATPSAGIYSSPIDTKLSVGFSPASQIPRGPNKDTYEVPRMKPDGRELFEARKISHGIIASEIPMAMCMNAPPCEDLIKADTTEWEDTHRGRSATEHNQAAENEQCFQALVRPPYRDLIDSDFQDCPQHLEEESESSNDETAECDQPYQRNSASSLDSAGHKRPPSLTDCQKREPKVSKIFTSVSSNQIMEMEKQSSSSDEPSPMQASVVPFMHIRADTTNPFRVKGTANAGCSKGVREESQRDSRGKTSYPYMRPVQTQELFTGMPTLVPQLPYNGLDIAEPLATFSAPFRPERPTLGLNFGGDFTISLKTGMKVIIRQGDLTDEFTNVIVSWADPHLRLQVGVGRAIRNAAGQELVSACQRWVQQHGPVKPGESVWTTGGNLKCSHVLHVVPAQRDGMERLTPVEMVKEMFVDILKTCTNSLEASMVSMPGIAAGAQVSRKVCAQAFFDAVLEITQLYQQGWLRLDTLVLVDQNKAMVMECQQVFSDAILSGSFNEFVQWEGSSLSNGQASCVAECADNAYNEFASTEPWKGNASGAVPRLRPKGSNWSSGKRHQKHPATRSKRYDPHPHAPSTSAIGDQWDRWEPAERERSISPRPVNECPICLGEIRNEKRLRCGHSFCRICVNTALKTRKYCPLCKQSV